MVENFAGYKLKPSDAYININPEGPDSIPRGYAGVWRPGVARPHETCALVLGIVQVGGHSLGWVPKIFPAPDGL